MSRFSLRKEFSAKCSKDFQSSQSRKKMKSASQAHRRQSSLRSLKHVKRVHTSDKDGSNLIYSLEAFRSKLNEHPKGMVASERSEALSKARKEIKYIHDYFSKIVQSGSGQRNVNVHKKEIALAFRQPWRTDYDRKLRTMNEDANPSKHKKIHVRFQIPKNEVKTHYRERLVSQSIPLSQSFDFNQKKNMLESYDHSSNNEPDFNKKAGGYQTNQEPFVGNWIDYDDRSSINSEMISSYCNNNNHTFLDNALGMSKTISAKVPVNTIFVDDSKKKYGAMLQMEKKLEELKSYINQKIQEKQNSREKPKYLRDILKNIKNKSKRKATKKNSEASSEKLEYKSLLQILDIGHIKALLLAIQDLSKSSNIYDIVFYTAKMRADFLVSRGDSEFNIALKIYDGLRVYSIMIDSPEKQLIMYEQCGYMNRLKKRHKTAIEMFKRMLQSAWILKLSQEELKAYHHLSIEYYYLEELDKSRYYLEKYLQGDLENDNSIIKQIYLQEYRIKKIDHHVPQDLDIQELKDEFMKEPLTSPSEGKHKVEKSNDYAHGNSKSKSRQEATYSPVGVTRKYKFLNMRDICANYTLINSSYKTHKRIMSRPPKAQIKDNEDYFLQEKKKNSKKGNKNIYSRKIFNKKAKSFHDIVHQAASRRHLSSDKCYQVESRSGITSNWAHQSMMRTKFVQDGIKELLANIDSISKLISEEKLNFRKEVFQDTDDMKRSQTNL
ncbi:unnamed protein product [Moneuplotes crassus]|uniref:Uncharacterized protein n=1 Tax=Euplotes crassus TaxID=5936 RepID=A0AAD1Y2N9_EUPCR|nr:unnamed protein product [Moneuplotes crassus]